MHSLIAQRILHICNTVEPGNAAVYMYAYVLVHVSSVVFWSIPVES